MQITVISGIFAIFFYLMGSLSQGFNVASTESKKHKVFLFGILAVIAHSISVYGIIRVNDGYHFGFFEISTLIALLISLLVLISSIRKPLENLFLGLFPFLRMIH